MDREEMERVYRIFKYIGIIGIPIAIGVFVISSIFFFSLRSLIWGSVTFAIFVIPYLLLLRLIKKELKESEEDFRIFLG